MTRSSLEIMFHYTEIFDDEVPILENEIPDLNMHKTISIICELIQSLKYKEYTNTLFGELQCEFPYEAIVKMMVWPAKPEDKESRSWYFDKSHHIYSEQYLLILLKYVLAFGNFKTLQETDYIVEKNDYIRIIKLCMAVGERQHEKFLGEISSEQKNHFIYGNYHLNNRASVAAAMVRTYYIFEKIGRNPNCIGLDNRNEFIDYNQAFFDKYGFNIEQLLISILWELNGYYNPDKRLCFGSIWKNVESEYSTTPCAELEQRVIGVLAKPASDFQEWAQKTLNEDWDFSEFLMHPFFEDGQGNYLSISEYTLSNAFFYNVFWMVRDCYHEKDSYSMAFYGRLFEKYLQDITEDAAKQNTVIEYIPEFTYKDGKNEKRSSDAYFKKGDSLIIVEMKGFMTLINVMIKHEDVEKNYKKLFVNPVTQALDRYNDIKSERFPDVNNIYVISVTMDSITSVPEYIELAKDMIRNKSRTKDLKDCFNFSAFEYELLLSLIEKNYDLFSIIAEYIRLCAEDKLYMFQNYVNDKFGIVMTDMMGRTYSEIVDKIKVQFGIE